MASESGTLSPEPRPLRDSPLLPAGAQVRRRRLHYPQPGECFSLCSPSCLFPFPGCGLHAHVQGHAQRSISLLVRKLVVNTNFKLVESVHLSWWFGLFHIPIQRRSGDPKSCTDFWDGMAL